MPFPGGGWSDSLGRMVLPVDPDALSAAELKALVGTLLGKVAELERTVAVQREEIARKRGKTCGGQAGWQRALTRLGRYGMAAWPVMPSRAPR